MLNTHPHRERRMGSWPSACSFVVHCLRRPPLKGLWAWELQRDWSAVLHDSWSWLQVPRLRLRIPEQCKLSDALREQTSQQHHLLSCQTSSQDRQNSKAVTKVGVMASVGTNFFTPLAVTGDKQRPRIAYHRPAKASWISTQSTRRLDPSGRTTSKALPPGLLMTRATRARCSNLSQGTEETNTLKPQTQTPALLSLPGVIQSFLSF